MIKDATTLRVSRLFSTDEKKLYRIPRYQREYTWRQGHWEDLYDDVFNPDNMAGYFLGSIIVIQGSVNAATGIYEYEVIDGQQRLTTISILLAALYAKLSEYGDEIDEEAKTEQLVPLRGRLVLQSDKTITRVIPQIQNNNLNDFKWVMKEHAGLKSSDKKPKNFGNRSIAKAFSYFSKRLSNEVEGKSSEEAIEILFGLMSRMLEAVVVQIDVDSYANAYTLFASLNNRGIPLTAVDLIKNTLLAKLAGTDEDKLDDYFDQWQEVLENLGGDYSTQERFFRQNYDAFRREVNAPYATEGKRFPLGAVATGSNLLNIYETRIVNDAHGVLDELIAHSNLYARIIGSDDDREMEYLDEQLVELARAKGVGSHLLLLYLMKNKESLELDDDGIAKLVSLLTRFFVRRNVTDTPPTRDLERMFISICEEIEDRGSRGVDALEMIKMRLIERSASDDEFKRELEGSIYDVNPDMTRFILTTLALETKETAGLWDRTASGKYVWTIEHIFPQGERIPKAWVDMIAGGDEDLAQEIRGSHVHTLGNLTITGYNSELSSLSFAEKRDRKNQDGAFVGYRNGLNLNADLVECDTWTKDKIEARTERLASQALEALSLDSVSFR